MSLARKFEDAELAPVTADWGLAFTRPPTKAGLAYWHMLRGTRPMPERRDLAPRAMARFLAHVNLVDVRAAENGTWNYSVALQGSHSREVLGAVQGRKLSEIFSPAVLARWRGCFDLPRSSRKPVRILTRASTRGKNHLACEALIAPLGSREEGVTALYWVFAAWLDGMALAPQSAFVRRAAPAPAR